MGLWDNIKNIISIPDEDGYDEPEGKEEPAVKVKQKPAPEEPAVRRTEQSAPRVFQGGKSKTVSYAQAMGQMQVVLVKPDRFEDAAGIADHLDNKKTVVLNLENVDQAASRRIVDFLSGAAYAHHGNMRKVAVGTFIIVPEDVDVMGEFVMDDFDDGKLYY